MLSKSSTLDSCGEKALPKKEVVCVFGGAGFLGSHVADFLVAQGYEVRVFDAKRVENTPDDREYILGDIQDFAGVSSTVRGAAVVYNFAALSDLNKCLDDPLTTIAVNISGNANILEAARQNGVRRFMYASSVYTSGSKGGFYRCSKQSAESYVEEYQRTFGLDYTILRYGSLYGPRSTSENGLFRIVKNALDTGIITYRGSADASREYIHVHDAAAASVDVLAEEFRNKKVVLTGPHSVKVSEMLAMLSEILDIKEINFCEDEQPVGHYLRTPYSYDRELGLTYVSKCHVDLGQGLLQLIQEIDSGAL